MAQNPYLKSKAEAAMARARGNRREAQKLLMAWAMEDVNLLRALVLPVLPGLTARAIAAAYGLPEEPAPGAKAAKPRPPRRPITAQELDKLAAQWGDSFDQAGARGPAGTAEDQAANLRALAVAHARRRYDPDRPND